MITRILITLAALSASAFGQSSFAVIVGKSNPATNITKTQLRRMVLGEMTTWPGGGKVLVLLASSGDPARSAMLKEICGMSESDYGKYLAQKSFAGDSNAPKTLPSTAVVVKVVQITPGGLGIGIVSVSDVNDSVKRLPVE
jgi:ABC-type phosphate transport system substrate-binding protein